MIDDPEPTAIVRDTFIFLRTRLAIDFSARAIDALAQHFPHDDVSEQFREVRSVPLLGFGDDGVTWSDGIVLRSNQTKAPRDIATTLDPALQEFDASVIHDRWGEFREHPGGGLVTRYFDQLWDGEYRELQRINHARPVPIAQIFVMSREDDRGFGQAVIDLRSSLREQFLPAFHFRDGQILFYNSSDPARLVARRFERFLRRLEHWAIVDSDGVTATANGEDESVWQMADLDELCYSDSMA
jgi:hypothetical protein